MPDITEPTLLLDEARCRANIRRMADKAKRSGARFRPHFKTHQSLEIGEWYRELGVEAITVSSVKMADYFSRAWDDITIAVPFNVLEIERVNAIRPECRLNLCVMHPETIEFLRENLRRDVGIWLKIDVGYHRTGLGEDDARIGELLDLLAGDDKLQVQGFLAHAGHTYEARNREEIRAIDTAARAIMGRLVDRFSPAHPGLQVSLGDSPGCSVVEDFTGIDELRPGNLVFYDLQQYTLGACGLEDIAIAMACPVIARHDTKLIVHGGGVHFSKDAMVDDEGVRHYGLAVGDAGTNWREGWGTELNGLKLSALSQEHGTLTGPAEVLSRYRPGDIVLVLPIHACMTASDMKAYTTLEGKRLLHLEGDYPLKAA
jgi:D-serine deaminase-like pyridoxal phosphate-dependent protein